MTVRGQSVQGVCAVLRAGVGAGAALRIEHML